MTQTHWLLVLKPTNVHTTFNKHLVVQLNIPIIQLYLICHIYQML